MFSGLLAINGLVAVRSRPPKDLAGLLKVTEFGIKASTVADGVIDSRLLTSISAGPVCSHALLPSGDLFDPARVFGP